MSLRRTLAAFAVLVGLAGACAEATDPANEARAPDTTVPQPTVQGKEVTPSVGQTIGSGGELPKGPVGDAFYQLPSPLPRGEPGEIIWAQEISQSPIPRADVYRILYHSRSLGGDDIAVSGTLAVPTGTAPAGGWPVVSWAHATVGVADQCAPSKNAGITSVAAELIAAGYVVVGTDYEGLGTPGPHPYLVGASEARGVLDAARAARTVGAANRVVVWGHSQGGQAALWAGEIAATYAPDVQLLGVVAAAPAARLAPALPLLAAVPNLAGFAVLGIYGMHAAYPELDLSAVLTPAALSALGRLEEACLNRLAIEFAQSGISPLKANPASVPAFGARIAANEAGQTRTAVPVFVAQGDFDLLTPALLTEQYVRSACGVGTRLAYKVYRSTDHSGVMSASRADTLAFIADRFAGRDFKPTC